MELDAGKRVETGGAVLNPDFAPVVVDPVAGVSLDRGMGDVQIHHVVDPAAQAPARGRGIGDVALPDHSDDGPILDPQGGVVVGVDIIPPPCRLARLLTSVLAARCDVPASM